MLDDNNIFDFDGQDDDSTIDSNDTDLWSIDDNTDIDDIEFDDMTEYDNDLYDSEDVYEQTVDLDGDGIEDSIISEYDFNGDLVTDAVMISADTDGDGLIDVVSYAEDLDFDGNADISTTVADLNYDGEIDYSEAAYITTDDDGSSNEYFIRATDLDFDGEFDDVEYGTEEYSADDSDDDTDYDIEDTDDADTDDNPDYFTAPDDLDTEPVSYDDNDNYDDYSDDDDYSSNDDQGYFDEEGSLILPTVDYDPDADYSVHYQELNLFDPDEADPDSIIGDPEEAMDLWECQGDTNRCALYAQKFVIEEYTGQEIDIEELADFAENNGWFSESGGTQIEDMSKLLDEYNIPNEVSTGNTVDDLAESLSNGNRVIVSLDSDEYWYGENDTIFTPDGVNHAVEVIGINNTDPDNPTVIINDSGVPEGSGLEVPLETFMDAWEDGNCHMIECM